VANFLAATAALVSSVLLGPLSANAHCSVILDAGVRRFQLQRCYLRAVAALRWINSRYQALQGQRPHSAQPTQLSAVDAALQQVRHPPSFLPRNHIPSTQAAAREHFIRLLIRQSLRLKEAKMKNWRRFAMFLHFSRLMAILITVKFVYRLWGLY
jgi:hypothetical protein